MKNWEPDKTGREPQHTPPEPVLAPSLTDSGASRPAPLYEVSAREREDEQRRHRDEFDEPFFCNDPFGEWIQSILDEKRGPE